MKKTQKTLFFLVITILFLAGFYALLKSNLSSFINNAAPYQVEIDTSNWVEYRNEIVGYSFKYPKDLYKVVSNTDDNDKSLFIVILENNNNDQVVTFYSHLLDYNLPGRGGYFGDVEKYLYDNNQYYILFGDKKREVEALEIIPSNIGNILVINGDKFDYSSPTVGPYSSYAAVINLEDSTYSGITIQPEDEIINYQTFVEILKSIRSI